MKKQNILIIGLIIFSQLFFASRSYAIQMSDLPAGNLPSTLVTSGGSSVTTNPATSYTRPSGTFTSGGGSSGTGGASGSWETPTPQTNYVNLGNNVNYGTVNDGGFNLANTAYGGSSGSNFATEGQVNSAATTLSNSPTQAANPYVAGAEQQQPMNYSSAASGCVGKIVGKYISNLIGSYISGYVSKAINAVSGAISGLFSGGLSGAASGAVSGATGGKVNINLSVPTYDAANFQKNSQTAQTNQAQEAQENFLKPLSICIANTLIQQMTQATVAWINNGFQNPDGTTGPAFVSNPKQFFTGIADREVGGFFQELGPVGSLLCKPFDIKVRLALLNEYRGSYGQQAQCSLASIKNNFQNFGKGSNGKSGNYWNDWFELTQKDQNNAMGSYFLARDQIAKNVQYNQDINRLEVTIGRGFLDMKKCVKYKADGKTCDEWTVTTPGTEVQASFDRALNIQGERINIANSFDDIVEALITQLLKRAMTGLQGN